MWATLRKSDETLAKEIFKNQENITVLSVAKALGILGNPMDKIVLQLSQ